jgi:hypothetical protein
MPNNAFGQRSFSLTPGNYWGQIIAVRYIRDGDVAIIDIRLDNGRLIDSWYDANRPDEMEKLDRHLLDLGFNTEKQTREECLEELQKLKPRVEVKIKRGESRFFVSKFITVESSTEAEGEDETVDEEESNGEPEPEPELTVVKVNKEDGYKWRSMPLVGDILKYNEKFVRAIGAKSVVKHVDTDDYGILESRGEPVKFHLSLDEMEAEKIRRRKLWKVKKTNYEQGKQRGTASS